MKTHIIYISIITVLIVLLVTLSVSLFDLKEESIAYEEKQDELKLGVVLCKLRVKKKDGKISRLEDMVADVYEPLPIRYR